MLWNASHVRDYELHATDGLVGTVKDFLFDETSWTVRWVVVDAGSLLTGRKVLLPPDLLGEIQVPVRRLEARVSRQQVEDSPGIDTDAPVSRQHEHGLNDHYGVPPYWIGYPLPAPTGYRRRPAGGGPRARAGRARPAPRRPGRSARSAR